MGSSGGGDNLDKMVKNCMKITNRHFWVKTVGDKPILGVVGGI